MWESRVDTEISGSWSWILLFYSPLNKVANNTIATWFIRVLRCSAISWNRRLSGSPFVPIKLVIVVREEEVHRFSLIAG